MTIGQRLAEYLAQLNLSQEEVAFKSGVTRQTINNAINNNSNLSGNVLEKILNQYPEIDPVYLMTGKKSIINTAKTIINKNTYVTPPSDSSNANEQVVNYEIINSLRSEIAALRQVIEAKDELISALKSK